MPAPDDKSRSAVPGACMELHGAGDVTEPRVDVHPAGSVPLPPPVMLTLAAFRVPLTVIGLRAPPFPATVTAPATVRDWLAIDGHGSRHFEVRG